jgi:hypothetical protein
MVQHPHLVEEDLALPADQRTVREVVKLASSINQMIQLTGECPSLHPSGKMPLLDTQVWVEDGVVQYEHYRKPVANHLLILEMSAMPAKMKRTVLTQEVVRIQRNIRPGLPWDCTVEHLNDFSQRMRASGYNEEYRFQVIKAGVEGFEKMREVAENGGRPVNRPRSWEEDLRRNKKELQGKNWFRQGGFDVPLFVPHTPRGELARLMKAKEAENNQGRKIRFKIIEKGGVTLEQKLRRSNPWAGGKCGRPDCFPCRGDKGGNCFAEGVTYNLYCEECGEKTACYKGETGRNGYTRGTEHLDSLAAQSEEKSVLWLHSVHHHQGRVDVPYSMRVTGVFRDTLDRQIMERVNISNFAGPVLMNRRNEMGGFRVERTQYRRWGGD